MDNNVVLVSSAVLFKEENGKDLWFLVKHSDSNDWEMPRTIVRKGESSVRASIRMIGEQGAITARVLEEVGRAGGVTTINDKTMPQRHLYYLMRLLSASGETIGFDEVVWLDYAKAVRKLTSKRERMMLQSAKKELANWRKNKKSLEDEEEEDSIEEEVE